MYSGQVEKKFHSFLFDAYSNVNAKIFTISLRKEKFVLRISDTIKIYGIDCKSLKKKIEN